MSESNDKDYLEILTTYIQVCAKYKPKLGHGAKGGYELDEFQRIYRADPLAKTPSDKVRTLPMR